MTGMADGVSEKASAAAGRAVLADRAAPVRRRRPAEVRQLLLEAGERVVVSKGRESANAIEIAREAGVHRSVLYRHFSSADELIQMATLRPFSEFLRMFESMAQSDAPEGPKPLWDLMYGFLDELLENLTEHREFLLKVLSEISSPGGAELGDQRRELDALMDQIALLSESQGSVRGVDVASIGLNTRLVIAMVAGVVSFGDWLLPRDDDSLERAQLIEQMSDLILYGVKQVPASVKAEDRSPRRPGQD